MAVAWRLLTGSEPSRTGALTGPFDGPFNMGVDEALLQTAVESGTPSLRFYTWQGPWLSVGYAQRVVDAERSRLAAAGVGLVRRATGGRAVLHGQDLTYAIAAPDGVLPEGVRDSYRAVADALLEALATLGVPVRRSGPDARAPGAGVFDCFVQPAADEICLGGRKLSGSAQRRVTGGFLQHGSIRLAPDPAAAVAAVMAGKGGPGGTSLQEEGHPLSPRALLEAILDAFEKSLGVVLEPAPLTRAERERARSRGFEPPVESHHRDAGDPRIPA
jgi:lipoate-protein ligase A